MTGSLLLKDKTLTWDSDQPETVEKVRKEFDQLINDHMTVVAPSHGQVKQFNPESIEQQKLVAVYPMAGG